MLTEGKPPGTKDHDCKGGRGWRGVCVDGDIGNTDMDSGAMVGMTVVTLLELAVWRSGWGETGDVCVGVKMER